MKTIKYGRTTITIDDEIDYKKLDEEVKKFFDKHKEEIERYAKEKLMSYKVGDKFVVEITDILTSESGEKLYQMNNMNTCVFDENGLGILEKVKDNCKFKVGDIVRITYGLKTGSLGMVMNAYDDNAIYEVAYKVKDSIVKGSYFETCLEKVEVK